MFRPVGFRSFRWEKVFSGGKKVFIVGKGCFLWENVVFLWENVVFSGRLADGTVWRWEKIVPLGTLWMALVKNRAEGAILALK